LRRMPIEWRRFWHAPRKSGSSLLSGCGHHMSDVVVLEQLDADPTASSAYDLLDCGLGRAPAR
jgi:hypothetical protein